MELHANPQIPGQRPKTMTTWTSPETHEQKRYYSKRKGKLTAYEMGCLGVQVVWAYYDFPAYKALFDAAFEYVPAIAFMATYLAAGLLILMHYLLKETYTTYWFDKLDNDEETDSSIWIPILLMLALFIAGRFGVQMAAKDYIPPPTPIETNQVDAQKNELIAAIDRDYKASKENIAAAFSAKISAATIKVDAEIAALKNRRPADEQARRTINGMISQLKTKRAAILAPIESAKADSLSATLAYFDAQKKAETARHSRATLGIEQVNNKKSEEYEATMGHVSWASWFISGLFVILYCALARAIVSIKVKSGILPLRDHTVLDQYGGPIGRMIYVLKDIFNRQFYRLSIFIHRMGTYGSHTLSIMDSSYNPQEADYNTTDSVLTLGKTYDDADLRSKVFQKVMTEAGQSGILVTQEMLKSELEKAKSMNGTYFSTPLGKPEPSAPAPAHTEGNPYPAGHITYDQKLREWADLFIRLIGIYDREMSQGRVVQAQEQMQYINSNTGPIVKGANTLGLKYGLIPGQPEVMVWKVENPAVKIPLSQVCEAAFTTSTETPEAGEAEDLFKQSLSVFKQTILPQLNEHGQVIGVKYKKREGDWVTYPLTQVEAYARNYTQRASKKPTQANTEGLEKWKYALSLFEDNAAPEIKELQPVTL